jgi:hypothetical protein
MSLHGHGSDGYPQVLEETGYNIKPFASEENCISVSIYSQMITLYIIHPVPEDTVFETRTRKEISVSTLINVLEPFIKFGSAN